jgi:hypothetical protein
LASVVTGAGAVEACGCADGALVTVAGAHAAIPPPIAADARAAASRLAVYVVVLMTSLLSRSPGGAFPPDCLHFTW